MYHKQIRLNNIGDKIGISEARDLDFEPQCPLFVYPLPTTYHRKSPNSSTSKAGVSSQIMRVECVCLYLGEPVRLVEN